MSRFPNSMERAAEEGSRKAAAERRECRKAWDDMVTWLKETDQEPLTPEMAWAAGWAARDRKASNASPPKAEQSSEGNPQVTVGAPRQEEGRDE